MQTNMQTNMQSTQTNEPVVLLAKGADATSDYTTKLSRAIVKSFNDFGAAEVQAIGPPAVSNSVKAFIKTKVETSSAENGTEIVCQFAYQKPQLGENMRTAIRARIFAVPSSVVATSAKDAIVLKAKGATASPEDVMRLAQAVVKSLSECSYAEVQAIGPASVSNTVKSFIKAKGIISEYVNGIDLVCQFSYQKPEVDGHIVTAIRAAIFAVPSKYVG